MPMPSLDNLSRRERQIMDAVYKHGRATAVEVMAEIPDPPTNAAVRAKLQVLVHKGYLRFEREGVHYVYIPVVDRESAEKSAIEHLLNTFFQGSLEKALEGMIELSQSSLSKDELDRIATMIEQARKEGR